MRTNTKFKRKQIIRAKNGEVYLVLAVSEIGVNILKFKTGGLWKEIPSLNCTVEDHIHMNACIEGVSLMTWDYFNRKEFIVISSMYDFKYNQIVNAISDYYKGLIISRPAPEGLIYIDEYKDLLDTNKTQKLTEEENNSANEVSEKQDPTIKETEMESTTEDLEQETAQPRTSTPIIFGKRVDNQDSIPSKEISEEKAIAPVIEEASSNEDTISDDSEVNNTSENNISESLETKIPEKRYDVLQMYRDACVESRSNAISSEKITKKREYKRRKYDYYIPPLTEIECLEIASMPPQSVVSKYDIPLSVAKGIRKEIIKLFSISTDTNTKKERGKGMWAQALHLFKEGKTKEEVEALFPDQKSYISSVYKKYTVELYKNTSPKEVELLKEELEKKEIPELMQYEKMSIPTFASRFKLSMNDAYQILDHLRTNVISKDPFVICGFDYGVSKENISMKDMYVYLCIDEIKDIYLDTFDHHGEILAGTFELPVTMNKIQKENLIKLIKNRFYRKRYKIEYMDTEQKNVVYNNTLNRDIIRSTFLIAGTRVKTFSNSLSQR